MFFSLYNSIFIIVKLDLRRKFASQIDNYHRYTFEFCFKELYNAFCFRPKSNMNNFFDMVPKISIFHTDHRCWAMLFMILDKITSLRFRFLKLIKSFLIGNEFDFGKYFFSYDQLDLENKVSFDSVDWLTHDFFRAIFDPFLFHCKIIFFLISFKFSLVNFVFSLLNIFFAFNIFTFNFFS